MTSSRSRIAREWCLRRFWSGYAYKRHALATLNTNPAVVGEFFNRPVTIEPAQTGVLHSTEHYVRLIIDREVIDVHHSRFDLQCYLRGVVNVGGVDGRG